MIHSPCCEPSCDGHEGDGGSLHHLCEPCPSWTFTADVLALQRTSSRNQPLFEDFLTSQPLLGAGGLDFPVAPGFQLSAIRHNVLDRGFDIEVGYFQTDWALNAGMTGPMNMVVGTDQYGDEPYSS